MHPSFQAKQTTLTFLAQICPKMDLGFEIQKTNVGIRVSIFEISCVPVFRQKEQLWLFWPKFARKWILGSEFQKSNYGFGISTSKRPCVPIFNQNGHIWIFRPKFGEYFGSYNIKRVAESWVEAEMSWVEVNGAGWRWVHGLVIPIFLIWRKNNISFSRYLDFCVSVKSTDFKICNVIIGIVSSGISTYAYLFWILRTLKKKFSQILVWCKTNISNLFLAQDSILETSSGPFYDLIKITI